MRTENGMEEASGVQYLVAGRLAVGDADVDVESWGANRQG